MNNLHLFVRKDPSMGKGFPVKNLQEVGDGIYQGQYDLDKMSFIDKVRALEYNKLEALAKQNLYAPIV